MPIGRRAVFESEEEGAVVWMGLGVLPFLLPCRSAAMRP